MQNWSWIYPSDWTYRQGRFLSGFEVYRSCALILGATCKATKERTPMSEFTVTRTLKGRVTGFWQVHPAQPLRRLAARQPGTAVLECVPEGPGRPPSSSEGEEICADRPHDEVSERTAGHDIPGDAVTAITLPPPGRHHPDRLRLRGSMSPCTPWLQKVSMASSAGFHGPGRNRVEGAGRVRRHHGLRCSTRSWDIRPRQGPRGAPARRDLPRPGTSFGPLPDLLAQTRQVIAVEQQAMPDRRHRPAHVGPGDGR